jgi:ABC-type microcin C transport system permease subunit YejB
MSFGVIRWILGAFCIMFAPAFGRSVVRFQQGKERQSKLFTWALRVILTGAAVSFRIGFDRTTIIVYILAILFFAAGTYYEWRPKHEDELEKVMFPRD